MYSTTLQSVSSARTRIERRFDPEQVRHQKAAADRDISVGGPGLAAAALASGLVDEYHVLIAPVIVGGGTSALPTGIHVPLELTAERGFPSGMVYLRYDVRP